MTGNLGNIEDKLGRGNVGSKMREMYIGEKTRRGWELRIQVKWNRGRANGR